MSVPFSEQLRLIQQRKNSRAGLWLSPRLDRLPVPIQRFDEPLFPFGKAVIGATQDLVCAYVLDMAAYLTFGGVGAVALERTIDYAGSESLVILNGGFTLPELAILTDENSYGVDAVTVADRRYLEPFTRRVDRGVFIMQDADTLIDPMTLPTNAGVFDLEQRRLVMGMDPATTIQLLPETVLNAGKLENFKDVIRDAVQTWVRADRT